MADAPEVKLLRHLHAARSALAMNHLPLAELHARLAEGLDAQNDLLQEIFSGIRRGYGWGEDFEISEKSVPPRGSPRYLLIKAWGYGFWSEVHHLLSQLLLAELTHRIPIIHWGSNCLFRRADSVNAFVHFFEPVTASEHSDIPADASFYPPKWRAENLSQEDLNKWDGPHSRMAAQYFFSRPETVAVSDFFSTLSSIRPWIGRSSRYFGLSDDALYTELFRQHLKPRREILERVLAFKQRKLQGRPWVAVHVRGSDKILESAHLAQINSKYFGIIERIEKVTPDIGVFLLTDSKSTVAEFSAQYGDRLCFTHARRSDNLVGVHMSGSDGVENGTEVLVDALLAIACDYFIGNRESNVSMAISSMRQWDKGFIFLLGARNVRDDDLYVHDRLAWQEGKCRLCGSAVTPAFEQTVQSHYRARYAQCPSCGSLQSELPFWQASVESDRTKRAVLVEALPRAVLNCTILRSAFPILGIQPNDRGVDIDRGEGYFARLMRDSGFHFFSLSNPSVLGTEQHSLPRAKVVTTLGVLESFEQPALAWSAIMAMQPDFVIGTIVARDGQGADWPELRLESGERVFFHSVRALAMVAVKHGYSPYTLGQFFLLTKHRLSDEVGEQLAKWSGDIASATMGSVLSWLQTPLTTAAEDRLRITTLARLAHKRATIGIDLSRLPKSSPRRRLWMNLLGEWALDGFGSHAVMIDAERFGSIGIPHGKAAADCVSPCITIACDEMIAQAGHPLHLVTRLQLGNDSHMLSVLPVSDFSRPNESAIARFKATKSLQEPYLVVSHAPPANVLDRFLHALDAHADLPASVLISECDATAAWEGKRVRLVRLALDDSELQSAYAGAHATITFSQTADACLVQLEAIACGCSVLACDTENDVNATLEALEQLFDLANRAGHLASAHRHLKHQGCRAGARLVEQQLTALLLDPARSW